MRLRRVRDHLRPPRQPSAADEPVPPARPAPCAAPRPAPGLSDDEVDAWVSRGVVVLPQERLGLPAGWHDRLLAAATEMEGRGAMPSAYEHHEALPLPELLAAPAVVAAVDALLGPRWGVLPFTGGGSQARNAPLCCCC